MSKQKTSSRPPITSINRYIERVIKDAMDSITWSVENPIAPKYWTMLIGNDLLVDIEPLYVSANGRSYLINKILYRLSHNMTKNFGVRVHFPGNAPLVATHGYELATPYDLRHTMHAYDYRHTLAKVNVFGEDMYLVVTDNYIWGIDVSDAELDHITEEFNRFGLNEYDTQVFQVYEDAVKHIFGHTALELWEYQLSHDHSIRGLVDWMEKPKGF